MRVRSEPSEGKGGSDIQSFGFHFICGNPPTILTATRANAVALIAALARLGVRDPILLVMTWWSVLVDSSEHVEIARQYHKHFPNGSIRFLANDALEQSVMQGLGLETWLCNHNCLVDETIFTVTPATGEFDAVYNASFHDFKRHYLAREIDSLLLIGYAFRGHDESAERVIRLLPSATIANDTGSGRTTLTPGEVANCLSRADVGLCLSAVEGAMYASIEYLMAGLPIVSTLSLGGRDLYFDDDFVRIVDPDPALIRSAVGTMAAIRSCSLEIRERTLSRVRRDRDRFLSMLGDLGVELADVDDARRWSKSFRHGMLRWGQIRELQQALPVGNL